MKLIDDIFGKLGFVKRDVAERLGQRSYKAGRMNRLTNDWITAKSSINKEIRSDINAVRNRARDLWKNNDYIRGYANHNRANVVGAEGFNLQVKSKDKDGKDDETSNKKIEAAFKEWCKKQYCTMSGTLSFVRVQWLLANQLERDGEFLVRKIAGPKVNKFGFSLELIEPDALDERFNTTLSNGNTVIMGVELNEWKRPVAYWLKNMDGKYELTGVYGFGLDPKYNLTRVKADEIIFGFDPEHTNQVRGMSHLAQSMITLHNLEGYTEAAIINARAGASKMGFIQSRPDSVPADYEGEDEDDEGNIISDFESGIIEQLPDGMEFKGWDPTYPHGEYQNFNKAHLRQIAAGLGRSYNTFANDLEGVNFSSMRSGMLDERDNWMIKQTLFRDAFLVPVFESWLKWSLLTGAIDLPYSNYDNYSNHVWQGRRWAWVDPLKDVNAEIKAIENGLSTKTDALAKQGKDINQVFETLQREKDLAGEMNINTKSDNNFMTVNEKRALVGLPPLPGGDAIYLPSSEIPAIEVEEG